MHYRLQMALLNAKARLNVFGKGSWLAWLAYKEGSSQNDIPPRWSLRWNTRAVDKTNMGQWYLEGSRRDMALYRHEEAILWRIDVTPFLGRPYTLWEIDHDYTRGTALYSAEKPAEGGIRHMGRLDFYGDADRALREFQAIAHGPGGYIRPWGTGEPPLAGDAWFRITEAHPHVLYVGEDVSDPLDVIDLTGRNVHGAIDGWLAGRTAAGLPRTSHEAELLAGREE